MWVDTSTTHCFRCDVPAPARTKNAQRQLLDALPPGHREVRGFVPPGAVAAGSGVPARPWQPAPEAAQAEVCAGPAGLRHLPPPPPPPPPPRGPARGRPGVGATYAPNATRDIRRVDRAAACSRRLQGCCACGCCGAATRPRWRRRGRRSCPESPSLAAAPRWWCAHPGRLRWRDSLPWRSLD